MKRYVIAHSAEAAMAQFARGPVYTNKQSAYSDLRECFSHSAGVKVYVITSTVELSTETPAESEL